MKTGIKMPTMGEKGEKFARLDVALTVADIPYEHRELLGKGGWSIYFLAAEVARIYHMEDWAAASAVFHSGLWKV